MIPATITVTKTLHLITYLRPMFPHKETSQATAEKQQPEVFCEKRCSSKFHKIHKKMPVPESRF